MYIYTTFSFVNLLLFSTEAFHYSINPPQNAFFLYGNSGSSHGNETSEALYLHDDCPYSTDQVIAVREGGASRTLKLHSTLHNYNCAVRVRVAEDTVHLDRPFIDVVALSDVSLLSYFRSTLCVSVKVSSPTAATVSATCELTPFEEGKHTCLLRIQIPFSWFGRVGKNSSRQVLSLSHTVSTDCQASYYDRPQVPITLYPFVEKAQAHVLQKEDNFDLSLTSRANLSFSLNTLNSLFVHLSINGTNEDDWEELELRAWIDSRFEAVNVAALSPKDWSVRPVSAIRPRFYTSFICTRLNKTKSFDGYIFAILLKMHGSVVENKKLQRNEEGVEAAFHWEIRRRPNRENTTKIEPHRIVTKFRVVPDFVYAVVPVAKSNDLINVAVLSSVQSTVPMKVISISVGGAIRDVTAISHCISEENRVLKTSPTCSSVYVDGSELRGMADVRVHVHFEKWVTSTAFTVWFPRLPITVWIRDPVLNVVQNWPTTVFKQLEGKEKARQFSCAERYQHTEIRILASFQVGDDRTGERLYLSGNRELLFDVTTFAQDRVQSADRSIAAVKIVDGRLLAYATGKGATRIILKSPTPNLDYGSSMLALSDEPVTVRDLSVAPSIDISVLIEKLQGSRNQYTIYPRLLSTFTHRYQHGSLALYVQYSDDQRESLQDLQGNEYNLDVHSDEEKTVAIAHRQNNRVDLIALDDFIDTPLRIILHPSGQCFDHESLAIAETEVLLRTYFDGSSNRHRPSRNNTEGPSTESPPPSHGWGMDTVLAVILTSIVIVALCRLVSYKTRSFRGYEKLVVPLLSRLSSSSSSGKDEDTKEWVWIGPDGNSLGSRYSQKSTMNVQDTHRTHRSPSPDEITHTNVSYRGSEISVFISPQPSVSVHSDENSWRVSKNKVRMTRNPMVDSSSEYNMALINERRGSIDPMPPPTVVWGSLKQPAHHSRRRPTDYEGLRESVA